MAISNKDDNLFRYVHYKPAFPSEKLKAQVKKEAEKRKNAKKRDSKKIDVLNDKRKLQILALNNLEKLDLTKDVDLANLNSILKLNNNGLNKLSSQTKNTLQLMGLDISKLSHKELTDSLVAKLAKKTNNSPTFHPAPTPNNQEGYIQDVGVANLLVVKQQILRYEASEIAHIENVIAGESKTRTHSKLTRTEEFSSVVNDLTSETETEFETTERFELNKQSTKTFEKDTELGLDLTVSGKYGPTVSFESNFKAGQTTSQAKSNEHATNFAKDTVERSKERIIEQITTTQEKTLIREVSEQNKHRLKNEDTEHRFAIYQYVDKIYESQVFDYGIRQMFDFMIPEPSSYLWYLKGKTAFELDLQAPKSLIDMRVEASKDITKYNYLSLGAQYGVNDLPEPPEIFVTKRIKVSHGDGSISDSSKHKSGTSEILDIPKGYEPLKAKYSILATSDETLAFSISIGGVIFHVKKSDLTATDVSGGHKKYTLTSNNTISLGYSNSLAQDQKLFIDIYGYESANYTFHFDVTFYALYDTSLLEYFVVSNWKQEVYEKLSEAYQTAVIQYEQEKSYLEAEALAEGRGEVDFGSPPAVNKKLIHTELKKHCLAIIRNEHLGQFATSHVGQPPQFNLTEAKEDGEIVRFLEHAFEWSQIQYVFYPYFWARPNFDQDSEMEAKGWTDKLFAKNNDFTMEEFLKAGYARVVVPVREGFDLAVSYFIENNGEVYFDLGEPKITNPLYISITDEIKERTDAGKDEIPVGDSWETRLPTAAVIVRKTDSLPSWVKKANSDWVWEPLEE